MMIKLNAWELHVLCAYYHGFTTEYSIPEWAEAKKTLEEYGFITADKITARGVEYIGRLTH